MGSQTLSIVRFRRSRPACRVPTARSAGHYMSGFRQTGYHRITPYQATLRGNSSLQQVGDRVNDLGKNRSLYWGPPE